MKYGASLNPELKHNEFWLLCLHVLVRKMKLEGELQEVYLKKMKPKLSGGFSTQTVKVVSEKEIRKFSCLLVQ